LEGKIVKLISPQINYWRCAHACGFWRAPSFRDLAAVVAKNKLRPRCCCGCGIFTGSIIMAILHLLPIAGIFYLPHTIWVEGHGEGIEKVVMEHKPAVCAIFGIVALAYAILGCVRTEEMCYVAGTINHLVATCFYVIAMGVFIFSGYIVMIFLYFNFRANPPLS